ncbi:terminase small subunit [Staphylococcus caeli]|uniref:Phage terminase n=1 Tax=Staphylococcus caeli TaxID=2201815 RepID=A0A1D4PQ93_9STAP|nr:terminase small subunit [Staphylococcus caeli]SCT25083.1 putative phage terminase [Staphylococcus caeli]SCT31839.1 putative phage terminase [Staphylococcus caeli]
MSELNPRQEKFVHEYIKTLNVTQSAIKAGYSPQSAHVQGSRLLKNEKVSKYIKEQKEEYMDESVLTAKELLHILTNAATGDETETKEVIVKQGDFVENPDTGRKILVYSERVEMVEVPIKASDHLKARDLLGKYHKIFTDKVDINAPVPLFIDVTGSSYEEQQEAFKEIDEKYPNSLRIIDDIGRFEE